jgi:hypothetical protein
MTRIELGMAAFDAVLVLVGYALLDGLGFVRPRLDLRLVPLAFLTGWAALGVVLSVVLVVGFDPSVPHVLVAAAGLVAAGILARRRSTRFELLRPPLLPVVPALVATTRSLRMRAGSVPRFLYGAGLALFAVVVVVGLAIEFGTGIGHVMVVAAGLCALVVVAARRRLLRMEAGRLLGGALAAVAAGVLVLAAASALIGVIKGTWPPDPDSWGFWVPKATTIFYWHGLDTGIGGWGSFGHPEYPPLLPVMYAACFHFAGGFHPSVLSMQTTLLAIAFVAGMLALLDRFVPRWCSFPFLTLLAVTPGFFSRTQSLLADPALAYMLATGAVVSMLWLLTHRREWIALGVVFLAAATLTKLEGLDGALLVVAVVVIPAAVRKGRWARRGLLLLLGPALIIPWRIWLATHGLPTSATDYHMSELLHPDFLVQRWWRFTTTLDVLVHSSVFQSSEWLGLFALALAAAGVAVWRTPAATVAMIAWLGLGFLGIATTYWIGLPNLAWYLATSANRVTSTLVIVAASLAPLLLGVSLVRQTTLKGATRRDP